jgi:ankyrin repeat protein
MLLLSCGADVQENNSIGTNVLMLAATSGNSELVALLLNRFQFDVNALDASGKTALGWSMFSGRPDSEIVDKLLRHGANPNSAESNDLRPIALACAFGFRNSQYIRPLKKEQDVFFESVEMLLRSGAEADLVMMKPPLAGYRIVCD